MTCVNVIMSSLAAFLHSIQVPRFGMQQQSTWFHHRTPLAHHKACQVSLLNNVSLARVTKPSQNCTDQRFCTWSRAVACCAWQDDAVTMLHDDASTCSRMLHPGADSMHLGASSSRRCMLLAGAATVLGLVEGPAGPKTAVALPLAPLGRVEHVGGDKRTGLTPEQVKDVLARDLSEGMYFVTGDLTPEIFDDQCSFEDPTNAVTGLSKYVKALGILFDPAWSKVILSDIRVTGPHTIEADWVLGGWLRSEYFVWQPKVEPFTGRTVYTLGDNGLIMKQEQTWSISGLSALQQTFTPVPGPKYPLL